MSDLSLPYDYPVVPGAVYSEMKLVRLAREVAMDIKELNDILALHDVDMPTWERLKCNERFKALLSAEVTAWHGAINTNERVKVKAGSMLEEFLPELYSRINDRSEPLSAKNESLKLLERLAGMGGAAAKNDAPSNGVTITINMGADNKLKFEQSLPPKVIEHEEVFVNASAD